MLFNQSYLHTLLEIKTLPSAFWFAECFLALDKEDLCRVPSKKYSVKNTWQRSSLPSVKKKYSAKKALGKDALCQVFF
jgi:hypothetical protein